MNTNTSTHTHYTPTKPTECDEGVVVIVVVQLGTQLPHIAHTRTRARARAVSEWPSIEAEARARVCSFVVAIIICYCCSCVVWQLCRTIRLGRNTNNQLCCVFGRCVHNVAVDLCIVGVRYRSVDWRGGAGELFEIRPGKQWTTIIAHDLAVAVWNYHTKCRATRWWKWDGWIGFLNEFIRLFGNYLFCFDSLGA